MIDNKYKKELLIGLLVFLSLFMIISLIYFIQQNNNKLSVKNYDSYLKLVPSDRRLALEKALYQRISNFDNFDKYNNDIVIRKNSYTEEYNKNSKTYLSKFIIDIDSMKQSYSVNFSWSKNNSTLMGDDLVFGCLSKDEVIFKNFDCKKSLGIEDIIQDEIIQYLPQSGPHYIITLGSDTGSILELNINIYLDLSEQNNSETNAAIAKYKSNAINWIQSKGLDINKYSINYIIN